MTDEMAAISTKHGIITEDKADFGYGMVWYDSSDDAITYMDSLGFKSWKTVRGFESWVKKQNAINGGVYDKVEPRHKPSRKTVLSWC